MCVCVCVCVIWCTYILCIIVRSDYSQASVGNVIFAPGGPNEQTVQLSVVEDELLELNETYLLRLDLPEASIVAGAQIGKNNQARVIIINDDSKIVILACIIVWHKTHF